MEKVSNSISEENISLFKKSLNPGFLIEELGKPRSMVDIITQGNTDASILYNFQLYATLDEDWRTNACLTATLCIRKHRDYVVLVDNENSRKTWKMYQEMFGFDDNQVVWIGNYDTMEDFYQQQEDICQRFKDQKITFVYFFMNKKLESIFKKYNIRHFSDDTFAEMPTKSNIHYCVPGSLFEEFHAKELERLSYSKIEGLKLPKGYTCYNKEDLIQAGKLLSEQGVKAFIIKHGYSCGGYYSFFANSEDEFYKIVEEVDFKTFGDDSNIFNADSQKVCYVVEEKLELLRNNNQENTNLSISLICWNDKVVDYLYLKSRDCVIEGVSSIMTNPDAFIEVAKQSDNLCKAVSKCNTGYWSADFLIAKDGSYFTDPNLGRCNSDLDALLFLEQFATRESSFEIFALDYDWETLYKKLKAEKLLYDISTKSGIIIISTGNGKCSYFKRVIIIGKDSNEVEKLKKEYDLLTKNL